MGRTSVTDARPTPRTRTDLNLNHAGPALQSAVGRRGDIQGVASNFLAAFFLDRTTINLCRTRTMVGFSAQGTLRISTEYIDIQYNLRSTAYFLETKSSRAKLTHTPLDASNENVSNGRAGDQEGVSRWTVRGPARRASTAESEGDDERQREVSPDVQPHRGAPCVHLDPLAAASRAPHGRGSWAWVPPRNPSRARAD